MATLLLHPALQAVQSPTPPRDGDEQRPRRGLRATVLGHEVLIDAGDPVPEGPLLRMLEDLDTHWDVRRRHSDLDRLTHHACVVQTVSPQTLLLVGNALTAIRLTRRAGLDPGPCDATLDIRHGRVGLDPTAAAITIRLTGAAAVDLLVDLCRAHGVRSGHVQVGDVDRELDDPVPAWLRRATDDIALLQRQQCRRPRRPMLPAGPGPGRQGPLGPA